MKRNFSNDNSPLNLYKGKNNLHSTSYNGLTKNSSNSNINLRGISIENTKNMTLSNLKMISKSELIRMIQNKNNQNSNTTQNQSYNNFNKNNYMTMTKKVDFNSLNSNKNDKKFNLPSLNPNLILNNGLSNNNNNRESETDERASPSIKKTNKSEIDFSKIKHKMVEKYRELSNSKKTSSNNLISSNETDNINIGRSVELKSMDKTDREGRPDKLTNSGSKKDLIPINHNVKKRRLSIIPKYNLNKGIV